MKLAPLFIAAASLHATTFYVTVSGLGGEPDYEQRFTMLANETEKTLKAHGGDVQIATLKGAEATRANLESALAKVAHDAKAQDAVVLLLIGHGTFDGSDYKFNLPGPDISAGELASALNKIPATRQLIVNTTSASGGMLEALKKPNRLIITATRAGTEKNATVFARFWVEALNDPTADTDKNGVINAAEAFQFAQRKTKEFYDAQKRLATEHPVLGDAQLAQAFPVVRITAADVVTDPAKKALQTKRDDLESQIDQLKYQKALLAPAEYKSQLSKLLLELATTQAELDK
jgi:Peptidase C13 family